MSVSYCRKAWVAFPGCKHLIQVGVLFFVGLQSARPQNLEMIGKKGGVKLTGGVSFNQVFYAVMGIDPRRPFSNYVVTGNLNLSLYELSIPVTFSYSDQNSAFQQPFNQIGFSPRYKWITAHGGFRNMTFSPYTLNGHTFLGGGIELSPPKSMFRLSAMYGRLLRAVPIDSLNRNQVPAFERWGYGFKAGLVKGSDNIYLSFFKGEDRRNSITLLPDSSTVTPQENAVVSLQAQRTFLKKLSLQAEYAQSALTRDTQTEVDASRITLFSFMGGLFRPRISTAYYSAYKGNLAWNEKYYSIGVGYERVDPGFTTHGAYFFNNDLENTTLNVSLRLFQDRLTIGSNFGLQRNNLNNDKLSTLRRNVGSVTIGLVASQELQLGFSYSNFQSYTRVQNQFDRINQVTQFDQLDTLNFRQIAQNVGGNATYSFGNPKKKLSVLNLNLSYQQTDDQQQVANPPPQSRFYNGNASYSLTIRPKELTITVALNFTRNENGPDVSTFYGPTLSANKSFFNKKLRTSASLSYNESLAGAILTSRIGNLRINNTLTAWKKHNFSLSGAAIYRATPSSSTTPPFTEFTGTFTYSYNS